MPTISGMQKKVISATQKGKAKYILCTRAVQGGKQDYQQLFREMSQCSLPSERRKSCLWQSLIDSSIDLTTSS